MTHYRLFDLCACAMALAWTCNVGATARADPAAGDGMEPGAAFAHGVTSRAQQGWYLSDVDVRDPPIGSESGTLRLAVTMSDGAAAERWTLHFDADGAGALRVHHRAVVAPARRRHYREETAIIAALRRGPARSLTPGCTSYALAIGGGTAVIAEAAIDPLDYYTHERRVGGAKAGDVLAKYLARSVRDERVLTAVDGARERRPGEHRAFEVILTGEDDLVLRVSLDGQDRVAELDVQRSRHAYTVRRYRPGAQRRLARAAARHGAVAGVAWRAPQLDGDEAGPASVVLEFADGTRYALDHDDFDDGDFECLC